jgi:hypothetical protein
MCPFGFEGVADKKRRSSLPAGWRSLRCQISARLSPELRLSSSFQIGDDLYGLRFIRDDLGF